MLYNWCLTLQPGHIGEHGFVQSHVVVELKLGQERVALETIVLEIQLILEIAREQTALVSCTKANIEFRQL